MVSTLAVEGIFLKFLGRGETTHDVRATPRADLLALLNEGRAVNVHARVRVGGVPRHVTLYFREGDARGTATTAESRASALDQLRAVDPGTLAVAVVGSTVFSNRDGHCFVTLVCHFGVHQAVHNHLRKLGDQEWSVEPTAHISSCLAMEGGEAVARPGDVWGEEHEATKRLMDGAGRHLAEADDGAMVPLFHQTRLDLPQ